MSNYKGDFAMLNPFPLLRDEDGEYHCPMGMMVRSSFEDDDAPRTKAMCGESLNVHWTVVTPVPDHDSDQHRIPESDACGWAVWSSWELKCAHGHVLATSADSDGNEGQPFDARHWWAIDGPPRVVLAPLPQPPTQPPEQPHQPQAPAHSV